MQQSLLKNLDDADAALLAQARLSRDVQQRLFAIRTVPFGSVSERLYRILRTTARELDKRANLEIVGGQVELDRSVLEKLVGPLEHLLRNALDHGIEPRETRCAAGKSETGEIRLTVRQVGNEIVIELARRRRRRGPRPGGGSRAQPGPHRRRRAARPIAQLIDFLFAPGILHRVEGHADLRPRHRHGRGAQRDRRARRPRRGRLASAGSGTRFLLTLPLTLAVAQAVLVRAGGRLWALPAPMVEQVQQVKAQALLDMYIQRKVEWQGKRYPFHYLPRLLGDHAHNPETKRYNPMLLLRSGQSYAAIHVDEMVGNQEVVVKNIGPQLARVSGHLRRHRARHRRDRADHQSGAARASGPRCRSSIPTAEERASRDRPRAPVAPVSTQPLVMIVDDSLTVRKITSRMLHARGLRGATAQDGVDALQLLERAGARRDPARHRDAAHGRLRVHQDDQGRCRSTQGIPDHHDHVAHRREASQPRGRARRRPLSSASPTRKRSSCGTCAR